jgi:hypothetical protein
MDNNYWIILLLKKRLKSTDSTVLKYELVIIIVKTYISNYFPIQFFYPTDIIHYQKTLTIDPKQPRWEGWSTKLIFSSVFWKNHHRSDHYLSNHQLIDSSSPLLFSVQHIQPFSLGEFSGLGSFDICFLYKFHKERKCAEND